jgi:SpoVK/Ycf46/Vps4 family AAA+-type ATPase
LTLSSSSSSTNTATAYGDAATPVLQGMTSYLQTLLRSIQHDRTVPFPRNNPLYNFNSNNALCGIFLPVHVCLVAIVTCPDNSQWWTETNMNTSGMGRYRLPNLTSETRWKAFQWAFQQEGIVLSKESEIKLPFLAAAAVWARGEYFQQTAQQLRQRILRRCNTASTKPHDVESDQRSLLRATSDDVQNEFHQMHKSVSGSANSGSCNVQFVSDHTTYNTESLFDAVGGNQEAKSSLQDALCLDPIRRTLLSSFGISPSTGLLLYGPPGTGK